MLACELPPVIPCRRDLAPFDSFVSIVMLSAGIFSGLPTLREIRPDALLYLGAPLDVRQFFGLHDDVADGPADFTLDFPVIRHLPDTDDHVAALRGYVTRGRRRK